MLLKPEKFIVSEKIALEYAIDALIFIANNEGFLQDFIAITGMTPDTLKQNIHDPATLSGVFDFLMQNESLFMTFCDVKQCHPEDMMRLRQKLPGGDAEVIRSI